MKIVLLALYDCGGQNEMLRKALVKYSEHEARSIVCMQFYLGYDLDIFYPLADIVEFRRVLDEADFYCFQEGLLNFCECKLDEKLTPTNHLVRWVGSASRNRLPNILVENLKGSIPLQATTFDWTVASEIGYSVYVPLSVDFNELPTPNRNPKKIRICHCLAEGTILSTWNGFRLINDQKAFRPANFRIYGRGQRRLQYQQEKTTSFTTGDNYLYELNTPTKCIQPTSEHPFLAIKEKELSHYSEEWRKSGKRKIYKLLKWTPLNQLNVGDYILTIYNLPFQGRIPRWVQFFTKSNGLKYTVDNPYSWPIDFWELLGWYLAEGSLGQGCVQIGQRGDRKQIIENLAIHSGFSPKVSEDRIRILSTQLKRIIENFGFGINSYNKVIPLDIMNLPPQQLLSFLRGYILGDGHYTQDRIQVWSTSKELLNRFRLCLLRFGLIPNQITIDKEVGSHHKIQPNLDITSKHICYVTGISGWNGRKMLDLIGLPHSTINGGSNSPNFKKLNNFCSVEKILSIEPLGKHRVYNLTTQTGNFIANGIIVHNSPTNREYKNTELFLKTMGEVEKEYPYVETVLIEGKPWKECIKEKATCDLSFDQMGFAGGYGHQSIESMALGMPVLCGLNYYVKAIHPDCPIVSVTKDSLKERIVKLIQDDNLRERLGKKGIEYCRRTHDIKVNVHRWISLFEFIKSGRDPANLVDFPMEDEE